MIARRRILLYFDWYDQRLHRGVLEYAAPRGWEVIRTHLQPHQIPEGIADGLIFLPRKSKSGGTLADRFKGRSICVDSRDARLGPCICPNEHEAGTFAAQHFIERNFKHLAVVQLWPDAMAGLRAEGFVAAAKTENVQLHKLQAWPELHSTRPEVWDAAITRWANKHIKQLPRPLGLFLPADSWACLALRLCLDADIHVPEEVAVVGVNNDPLQCKYAPVPLSSVDLNWERVGFEGARLLDALLAGKKIPALTTVSPLNVVTRRSSDVMAVGDIRVARALRLIQDSRTRAIKVNAVAQAVGVPLRTLQTVFKKELGRTIREEMNHRRLSAIEEEFRKTDRTATQIADDLEFCSVYHMLRFFKAHTGMTTSEFRALEVQ